MLDNRELTVLFYEAINRRDWTAVERYLAPGVEWFDAARGELVRGPEAVVDLFRARADAMPDRWVEVHAIHVAGDVVITECALADHDGAIEASTARPLLCTVVRFVDGRCSRGATYADAFRLLEQTLAA